VKRRGNYGFIPMQLQASNDNLRRHDRHQLPKVEPVRFVGPGFVLHKINHRSPLPFSLTSFPLHWIFIEFLVGPVSLLFSGIMCHRMTQTCHVSQTRMSTCQNQVMLPGVTADQKLIIEAGVGNQWPGQCRQINKMIKLMDSFFFGLE